MPARPRTRILIVDDSVVMRSLLRSVLSTDADLEVIGTAADGESALRSIELQRPDLILLDVEMPVMDGLATLQQLRIQGHKMPVIICSSLTQHGARVTIKALTGGASDYVTKPAGQCSHEAAIQAMALDLIPKIRALTGEAQAQPRINSRDESRIPLSLPVLPQRPLILPVPSILAIGVSTGGPAALDVLLPALPGDFPLPVLIVQHMPELFTKPFADRLNKLCSLQVREAKQDDPVCAGTILIARGDWHMEVQASASAGKTATLRLNQGAPENHCRPAVDLLFRSLARVFGSGALGVVMTGMGSDGLEGCRAIRAQGGTVLAQDQATSTVWGMPGAVSNAGLAHCVLPLSALSYEIIRIAGRMPAAPGEARQLRRLVR